MIRKSIILKLWLSILILMLVAIAFLGVFLGKYFDDLYYSFEIRSLLSKANHIAEVVVFREDKKLATEIIWELAREINASVVIDTRWESIGTIATGPRIDEIPEEARFSAEDIELVYSGFSVTQRGTIVDTQTEILSVAVPLVNQRREIFGVVMVYKPAQQITEIINEAKMLIVYTFTIAFLLSIVLAFYLTKRISDPLLQMNEVAQSMAEGKFTGNIEVKTEDEIGTLGRTMNVLALELNSSIQSLNKEKEQLNSILSSMSDAVITINKNQQIVIANPPATKLLKRWILNYRTGYKYPIDRLPQELVEIFKDAFTKEEETYYDTTMDGRSYAVTIDPLYHMNKINGVVVVLRDVTEEKRMDKLRKDFVANVSHELRTPLSMLQGYSEALLDDIADDPKMRNELAGIIYDESIRMKRLVNDLLDLAKLEARQIELEKETVEVGEILDNLIKKYKKLHENKNFTLTIQGNKPIYTYIDVARIEQVLINLIDNAIRHTDEKGQIEIKAALNDMIIIEVTDNGVGIPEEDVPFVFERFYKADKARTRSKSGTGLGLAISKNIIEAHSGEISVRSQVGKGTTFTIELPKLAS
ncbi:ATP-binding protein [Desulfuribacillus alkaliarsenatis]|uniref:histidine kinase n=1 Tax=Desulfuribacillus alkaliarsenatis TaxID=766136 RepID=A0A1E5G5S1_9FIRM|nr:ATP-binding protein [Desulfuribacillus alkaliarsenatis]OEF98503.1 hypothetical protein BHF68_02180 [Desulfuribacillus alkaliarsenatis]